MSVLDDVINMTVDIDTFLEEQTEDVIQDRMFGRVNPELDKSEGSYIWDAIAPTSFEHTIAYMALRYALYMAFPQRSFGDYLSLHSAAHGSPRKEAVAATGTVTVTGSPGAVIPIGTKFSNTVPMGAAESPKYFSTTEAVTIPASESVNIPVQADTAGAFWNVHAGEINLNIEKLGGIFTVTNTTPLEDGVDEETDLDLLPRMLDRVQNPPSSGNKADYKRWAREVPGVGDAIIQALWNGPGTVKVIVIGTDGGPVSAEVVADTQTYLDPGENGTGDGKAPVGASVTVGTVDGVQITIAISSLELEDSYLATDVEPQIERRIKAYLAQVAPGGVVRIKEVEAAVTATPGVLDFATVSINGSAANLQLAEEEKAVLDEVVLQ